MAWLSRATVARRGRSIRTAGSRSFATRDTAMKGQTSKEFLIDALEQAAKTADDRRGDLQEATIDVGSAGRCALVRSRGHSVVTNASPEGRIGRVNIEPAKLNGHLAGLLRAERHQPSRARPGSIPPTSNNCSR